MNRFILPLTVIGACGEIHGITRIQKVHFLIQNEVDGVDQYTFEPKQYGPYSALLGRDIEQLVRNEFVHRRIEDAVLSSTTTHYSLTPKGEQTLENAVERMHDTDWVSDAQLCAQFYEDRNLWDLLDYIDRNYHQFMRNAKLSTSSAPVMNFKAWEDASPDDFSDSYPMTGKISSFINRVLA